MPATHNANFRIGHSKHDIQVRQSIDPATGEWDSPTIAIPAMRGLNAAAAVAATKAIGKAVKLWRKLRAFTGRPAK